MRVAFVVAVLAVGCAARAKPVPAAAPAVSPDPRSPELVELETAFRTQDREISEELGDDSPLVCARLRRFQDELGRLAGKICKITSAQEGGRWRPGASCRYAMERSGRLRREAERRGCKNTEHFYDPMPRLD